MKAKKQKRMEAVYEALTGSEKLKRIRLRPEKSAKEVLKIRNYKKDL